MLIAILPEQVYNLKIMNTRGPLLEVSCAHIHQTEM